MRKDYSLSSSLQIASKIIWQYFHATTPKKFTLTMSKRIFSLSVRQNSLLTRFKIKVQACFFKAFAKEKGHLVFEVRDPSQKAWRCWNRENTYQKLDIPEIGEVEGWCEVTEVSQQLVSFRWTYVFASDGQVITSDSTLRFREKAEIEQALINSGFLVREVRDAPDRPGKELVFIASKAKD